MEKLLTMVVQSWNFFRVKRLFVTQVLTYIGTQLPTTSTDYRTDLYGIYESEGQ
jgi:hypothetical protein